MMPLINHLIKLFPLLRVQKRKKKKKAASRKPLWTSLIGKKKKRALCLRPNSWLLRQNNAHKSSKITLKFSLKKLSLWKSHRLNLLPLHKPRHQGNLFKSIILCWMVKLGLRTWIKARTLVIKPKLEAYKLNLSHAEHQVARAIIKF